MALFIDTFVNKIDRKGRVSVPATLSRGARRAKPSTASSRFRSFKFTAVQCAGIDWMQRLSDEQQRTSTCSPTSMTT